MHKVRIGFKSLLVIVIFIVTTVTAVGVGLMNASSSSMYKASYSRKIYTTYYNGGKING